MSWQSRLQSSVALSSMEAEYMAASAATQEAMWLNRLLQQLGFKTTRPTKIYFQIRRSKHIILGDTLIEMLYSMVISCWNIYPQQAEQLADGLIKPLSGAAQHQVICLDNYLSKFIFMCE